MNDPLVSSRGVSFRFNPKSNKMKNYKDKVLGLFTLSYAKDLAAADKIPVYNILTKADEFNKWLNNN